MKNKIILAVVAILLVVAVIFAIRTGKKSDDQKKDGGNLVVGSHIAFAPFEFYNEDGEAVGFDIDLLDAIGEKIGYKMEYKDMAFDGVIPALTSGNIDLIIAGMTINEERLKVVNFSDPYYNSGSLIAVLSENTDINDFADLEGKKIGVTLGTTHAELAKSIKDTQVIEYDSADIMIMSLVDSKVDAIINDAPVLQYYTTTDKSDKVKTVGSIVDEEGFGIAIAKSKTELLEKINFALKELKDSGEYDRIYNKWFGGPQK